MTDWGESLDVSCWSEVVRDDGVPYVRVTLGQGERVILAVRRKLDGSTDDVEVKAATAIARRELVRVLREIAAAIEEGVIHS